MRASSTAWNSPHRVGDSAEHRRAALKKLPRLPWVHARGWQMLQREAGNETGNPGCLPEPLLPGAERLCKRFFGCRSDAAFYELFRAQIKCEVLICAAPTLHVNLCSFRSYPYVFRKSWPAAKSRTKRTRKEAKMNISVLLFSGIMAAHSWYPYECCHEKDCHEANEFIELPNGDAKARVGSESIEVPSSFKRRSSKDEHYHVCYGRLYGRINLYCVFQPLTA